MIDLIQDDAIAGLTRLKARQKRWHYCMTSVPYFWGCDYQQPLQYGLEPRLSQYLDVMESVFGLIYDQMFERGVLWLNIANTKNNYSTLKTRGRRGTTTRRRSDLEPGHRQKQLIRVASRLVDRLLETRQWVLFEEIIWNRGTDNQPQDGRTHQTHEYVFVLVKHGVARPMPWYTPLNQSVITCRPENYEDHPCKMPQSLADTLIGTATHPQATVIDPFIGTGTTAIAAHRRGYNAIGIDLDISTAQAETAALQQTLKI